MSHISVCVSYWFNLFNLMPIHSVAQIAEQRKSVIADDPPQPRSQKAGDSGHVYILHSQKSLLLKEEYKAPLQAGRRQEVRKPTYIQLKSGFGPHEFSRWLSARSVSGSGSENAARLEPIGHVVALVI